MHAALARCTENFRLYWGQALLNALKALHALRYNEELAEEITEITLTQRPA